MNSGQKKKQAIAVPYELQKSRLSWLDLLVIAAALITLAVVVDASMGRAKASVPVSQANLLRLRSASFPTIPGCSGPGSGWRQDCRAFRPLLSASVAYRFASRHGSLIGLLEPLDTLLLCAEYRRALKLMGDRLHLLAGSAIFLDDLLCEETDEMRADHVREWTQPAIECALLCWKSCLEKPPQMVCLP